MMCVRGQLSLFADADAADADARAREKKRRQPQLFPSTHKALLFLHTRQSSQAGRPR
jgi:hypothetical protein